MAPIDLRAALNAISDVVTNRPQPLREFDQIYMKVADMLLHVEHLSRWLDDKEVIFIGDGDAIGLTLMHLHKLAILEKGPRSIHVLDFDERILNAIKHFSERFALEDKISVERYNVVDPLPIQLWQYFDAFYTNPPFGASNGGKSVEAFMRRGMEATGEGAIACIAVADSDDSDVDKWTYPVLQRTQKFLLDSGFYIAEMIPSFHHYHLDDAPELTSCSLVTRRIEESSSEYSSVCLPEESLLNFYGKDKKLKVKYVDAKGNKIE